MDAFAAHIFKLKLSAEANAGSALPRHTKGAPVCKACQQSESGCSNRRDLDVVGAAGIMFQSESLVKKPLIGQRFCMQSWNSDLNDRLHGISASKPRHQRDGVNTTALRSWACSAQLKNSWHWKTSNRGQNTVTSENAAKVVPERAAKY